MVKAETTGLTMIGGGVPKNFAQDVVLCTEELGVADARIGGVALVNGGGSRH